jgi:hypothetical protein
MSSKTIKLTAGQLRGLIREMAVSALPSFNEVEQYARHQELYPAYTLEELQTVCHCQLNVPDFVIGVYTNSGEVVYVLTETQLLVNTGLFRSDTPKLQPTRTLRAFSRLELDPR